MARAQLLAFLLISIFCQCALALNPITISGNHFVDSVTNKRFIIVGLAYQPKGEAGYDFRSGRDTLTDGKACLRDAIVMQQLGINTIRVYNVNPYLNHDECMTIFHTAGIYLALDVNSPFPGESINRINPSESYHPGYITRLTAIVDAFKNYPNLLCLFAGNEIVNDIRSARISPPYIRAVQRDLKQYIRHHSNRTIPVGYSASDDRLRHTMHRYLSCGQDIDSRADFYGLNSYEWCHGSTWETSGYQRLIDSFNESPIPIFFSEYGCNAHRPRSFAEVAVLYGERMGEMWSGGIIYEYSEERSGYGLVQLQKTGDVALTKEYDALRSQYNQLNFPELNGFEPTVRDFQTCSEEKMVDEDGKKERFNFTLNLPQNPSPEIATKNYTSKNRNLGKIIEVPNLKSEYKLFSSNGVEIKDFELKLKVDKPNAPIGKNDSTPKPDEENPSRENIANPRLCQPSSSLGILIILAYLFLCQ
ncbi:Glucanosyltransferase-domain-containing protein [Peziza echinospora]|nr:Glucanosyltransferase-domain-containing protein [Peziza echinospora]